MIGLLGLAAALALTKPADGAPACRMENARYELREQPEYKAGFAPLPKGVRWKDNVAFYVRSGLTRKVYWFLFDRGSAPRINMISMGDPRSPAWRLPENGDGRGPLGEMLYLQADDALRFSLELPQSGQKAPHYVLLPDLPEKLRYAAEPSENTPLGFFVLTGC